MKPWQHGFDIEWLKKIESSYAKYNSYTLSPFAKYKKNNIAEGLHKGLLVMMMDHNETVLGSHVEKKAKVSSNITMYGNVVIGKKQPGDLTLTCISGNADYIDATLKTYEHLNTWLYVWAEDTAMRDHVKKFDYTYVGCKITTFGEIYSIYFSYPKDSESATKRVMEIDMTELLNIKHIGNVSLQAIDSIKTRLAQLSLNFQDHYSNYNKKKSWSALSLRGYSDDVTRIEKPIEMSDSWHKDHVGEDFVLQDTYLREQFPEVEELLNWVDGDIQRIRFMRLAPGGGELERHTDQVDPESGGNIGQVARLHFPIKTNDDVIFRSWDTNGIATSVNMKVGQMWYLDTRKPHTAVNNGTEERIHLVVDVVVTPKIKEMLLHDDTKFN
jgi:hypothetical protein